MGKHSVSCTDQRDAVTALLSGLLCRIAAVVVIDWFLLLAPHNGFLLITSYSYFSKTEFPSNFLQKITTQSNPCATMASLGPSKKKMFKY